MRQVILILLLVLITTNALAVVTEELSLQFYERHIPQLNGGVYAAVKDQDGYYWFASREGLKRFDGNETVLIANQPGQALYNKTVQRLSLYQKVLWVGTSFGAYKLNLKDYKMTEVPLGPVSHNARSHFVSDVHVNPHGQVWVSTPIGIRQFNNDLDLIKQYSLKQRSKDKPDQFVVSMAADSNNKLWVASLYHGLQVIDLKTGEVSFASSVVPFDELQKQDVYFQPGLVSDIKLSRSGNLLLIDKYFFYELSKEYKLLHKIQLDGFSDAQNTQDLEEDQQGNVWIVNSSGSLIKISKARDSISLHRSSKQDGSLRNTFPNALYIDSDNSIVVLHLDGKPQFLSPIQQATRTIDLYSTEVDLKDFHPTASLAAGEGSYWMYNSKGEILKIEQDYTVSQYYKLNLKIAKVISVGQYLWFAAVSGVYQYHLVTKELTRVSSLFSTNIAFSPKSGIWVSATEGLVNVDPDTHEVNIYSVEADSILFNQDIAIDEHFNVWFFTAQRIYRFNETTKKFDSVQVFKHDLAKLYQAEFYNNSLAVMGDFIFGFTYDDSRLSLSYQTPSLNKDSANNVIRRDSSLWFANQQGHDAYRFDLRDGRYSKIPMDALFSEGQNPLLVDVDDHRLVFFDQGQLTIIEHYQQYLKQPRAVVIHSVRVINDSSYGDLYYGQHVNVSLNPSDHGVSFEFSDFSESLDTDNTKYQYRLLGHSETWVDTKETRALYTGLEPGHYVFQVRNRRQPANISQSEFQVSPSFYQSNLAKTLYFIFALSVVLLIVMLRRDKVLSKEKSDNKIRIYSKGFDKIDQGVCVIDQSGKVLSSNPAFSRVFASADAEFNFCNILDSASNSDDFNSLLASLQQNGDWFGLLHLNSNTANAIPMEIKAAVINQGHGRDDVYMLVLSDISERIAHENKLQEMADTDYLTGLPNRNFLSKFVRQKVESKCQSGPQPFSILFMDVDRFKNINDSLNHEIGDQLLVKLSSELESYLDGRGVIARLGGDEFVIVIDLSPEANPAVISREILTMLEQPIAIKEYNLYISLSIGIALFPDDGDNLNLLLSKADVAMYAAKETGGNAHQFYSGHLASQSQQALKLESDIRNAICNQEFVLHYQAKVDISSREVVAYEALIRWLDPRTGLVPPGLFIEVAERTGCIIAIGFMVLRMACEQVRFCLDNGWKALPIAINVSPLQLRQSDFSSQARAIIKSFDIDPRFIEFEITESTVMPNSGDSLKQINDLHAAGHKIHMDDFGTGYSSLSYLQKLPIDVLKIDQSFVKNLSQVKSQQSIVKSIIELALNLDLELVAEGVEDLATAHYLQALGCPTAQGFYYARPVPADQLKLTPIPSKIGIGDRSLND